MNKCGIFWRPVGFKFFRILVAWDKVYSTLLREFSLSAKSFYYHSYGIKKSRISKYYDKSFWKRKFSLILHIAWQQGLKHTAEFQILIVKLLYDDFRIFRNYWNFVFERIVDKLWYISDTWPESDQHYKDQKTEISHGIFGPLWYQMLLYWYPSNEPTL